MINLLNQIGRILAKLIMMNTKRYFFTVLLLFVGKALAVVPVVFNLTDRSVQFYDSAATPISGDSANSHEIWNLQVDDPKISTDDIATQYYLLLKAEKKYKKFQTLRTQFKADLKNLNELYSPKLR